MKRDMDILREVLLRAEAIDSWDPETMFELEGRSRDETAYHTKLALEAGLLDGSFTMTTAGPRYVIRSLTWYGHEFLDAARNDTLYRRVVNEAKSKGISLSLDLLKEALQAGIRSIMMGGSA